MIYSRKKSIEVTVSHKKMGGSAFHPINVIPNFRYLSFMILQLRYIKMESMDIRCMVGYNYKTI